MGEEYGETSPFQFFTSYLDQALVEAVRRGRAAEFTRFGWRRRRPDPGRPATFLRSRLNHSLAGAPRHRELREYYRRWLALRRSHPALGARGKERTQVRGRRRAAACSRDPRGARRRPASPGREPHQHRAALCAAVGGLAGPLDSEDPRFARRRDGPARWRPSRLSCTRSAGGVIAS